MKKSIYILLACAGSALVAGCSLAPQYVRPEGAIPSTLPSGVSMPSSGGVTPDSVGWRDFFTDPQLRQVIALALQNNRDLRLAAANVQKARAQYRVQRADRLPSLTASGAAVYSNNQSGATDANGLATGGLTSGQSETDRRESYALSAGLSAFEIDLFGRIRNLSESAQQRFFASEEAQATTWISIIAETASAYLTLAADHERLDIARNNLHAFQESFDLTKAQFEAGVGSELEMRQAEAELEKARHDIGALTTQIAIDRNALDLLVGESVPVALLPQNMGERDRTISDVLPINLSSEVLLRRPDVREAEHLLIAENANIGAARAALFPKISLTAAVGVASPALTSLFDGGTQWTVSPQATIPIFDFGKRRADVQYAEANKQAAVATYEKTLQTAFREVADALATQRTVDARLNARTARMKAADSAARLSDARYKAGVASYLVSLDALRTAYAANQDLVTTRLDRANNLVALYRALGGGLRTSDDPM